MALTLKTSDQPVTLKATFLDAVGQPDTSGKVAFADDPQGVITLTDAGDGTATITASAAGSASVTATITDPDGSAVSTPPFGVTVVDASHDASTGSIEVASNPNLAAAAEPAATAAPEPAPATEPPPPPPA